MDNILHQAQQLFDYAQDLRRDFHRHPELGFREVRTAGVIVRELNKLGLEVRSGVGKTGVVAILEGNLPGPNILARFDMDALPVTEETGAEYASETPGLMHACGHDGHISIGITTARLLAERRNELRGSVKFVFQPAEEGLGGAAAMLQDGVLENSTPDYCLALHIWNERPLGWLAVTPGPFMAGFDSFWVRITGKGGHGALPQTTIDPILAAAQWINAMQSIISRNISPLDSAVVSITQMSGGEAFNVIPSIVELKGTVRTFDDKIHQMVFERFEKILTGVGDTFGCKVEWGQRGIAPSVVNDPQVTRFVQKAAERVLPDHQLDSSYQTMVSEDMSLMLEKVPGCYFMVGSANPEKGLNASHHHPRFDFDESVLPQAAALMTAAIEEIGKG